MARVLDIKKWLEHEESVDSIRKCATDIINSLKEHFSSKTTKFIADLHIVDYNKNKEHLPTFEQCFVVELHRLITEAGKYKVSINKEKTRMVVCYIKPDGFDEVEQYAKDITVDIISDDEDKKQSTTSNALTTKTSKVDNTVDSNESDEEAVKKPVAKPKPSARGGRGRGRGRGGLLAREVVSDSE